MVVQSVLTVLTTLVFMLPAQRGGNPHDPPRTVSCSANGATCLFGEDGGCMVTCLVPMTAYCRAAYCCYGFPHPAICKCLPG
jgi:hypothetical protein